MKYNPIKLKCKNIDDKGFDNSLLDYEDFIEIREKQRGREKGVNISNSF